VHETLHGRDRGEKEVVQTERGMALHEGIFSKYATPVGAALLSTALGVGASVAAIHATNTMAVGALVPRPFAFTRQHKQYVSGYH
jgi:hypothetical protein